MSGAGPTFLTTDTIIRIRHSSLPQPNPSTRIGISMGVGSGSGIAIGKNISGSTGWCGAGIGMLFSQVAHGTPSVRVATPTHQLVDLRAGMLGFITLSDAKYQ